LVALEQTAKKRQADWSGTAGHPSGNDGGCCTTSQAGTGWVLEGMWETDHQHKRIEKLTPEGKKASDSKKKTLGLLHEKRSLAATSSVS